jgi:two-component system, NtrC family, response regulator PilR
LSGSGTPRILVVDDEKSMREFLEILLTKEGYGVTVAENGTAACQILESTPFDMVITDIRMKDIDGIGVLRKAKSADPEAMVVLISAFATAETAVEAMKEGAYDYIPKPFKVNEIKRIVKESLDSRIQPFGPGNGRRGSSPFHLGTFIGESPQMRRVYDLIKKVACTKSNILVTGESGTGKELVASAVHRLSERRENPFVVINCAGIPENLIESELFGYKKGAFTGASADKEGLFQAAHGGTVFLDEVGELSPAIQVKLLRVIQERTFTAVGGTEEKNVDVRLISATNKDLEKEVVEGRFREDLYFRLNVIHIVMPPLRQREGDLALLAQYFLEKYSRGIRKEHPKDLRLCHGYPGTVHLPRKREGTRKHHRAQRRPRDLQHRPSRESDPFEPPKGKGPAGETEHGYRLGRNRTRKDPGPDRKRLHLQGPRDVLRFQTKSRRPPGPHHEIPPLPTEQARYPLIIKEYQLFCLDKKRQIDAEKRQIGAFPLQFNVPPSLAIRVYLSSTIRYHVIFR